MQNTLLKTVQYWEVIAKGLDLKPISEIQLRERLKKSFISLESQQRLSFNYFLNLTNDRVISADKMMNKAKGPAPVWHKKQKRIKASYPKRYGHLIKKLPGVNPMPMAGSMAMTALA